MQKNISLIGYKRTHVTGSVNDVRMRYKCYWDDYGKKSTSLLVVWKNTKLPKTKTEKALKNFNNKKDVRQKETNHKLILQWFIDRKR